MCTQTTRGIPQGMVQYQTTIDRYDSSLYLWPFLGRDLCAVCKVWVLWPFLGRAEYSNTTVNPFCWPLIYDQILRNAQKMHWQWTLKLPNSQKRGRKPSSLQPLSRKDYIGITKCQSLLFASYLRSNSEKRTKDALTVNP